MDKLRAIRLFVRLADLGSFTKVADEMDTSKSLISKEISRLEADIGARLLQRSTRNLQLTQVGEGYLRRCRDILAQVDDAEAYVQDLQGQPRGKLRVNAPMALGLIELSRCFSQFMQVFPEIELDIHLGDESVDLIEQGFDLGFRAASQPFDSNYVGKALTQFSYRVCVSPNYLAAHGAIETPQDLKERNCFIYSYFRGKQVWPLEQGVSIQGSLRVNSTIFMKQFIEDGLGIGFLPDFICREELAAGKLVEILADAERPKLTLYALYPARHFVPPKLGRCVEFLEDWFRVSR